MTSGTTIHIKLLLLSNGFTFMISEADLSKKQLFYWSRPILHRLAS